jgi:PiT family inorganic phosphate transporter
MAWNIGANDVANAMATSVGSGALTLKRAVIFAAVLEFAGAFLVGSSVTDTVRKGIIDPNIFIDVPDVFACGMVAALLAAGTWLMIATYFGWPVSTTHSIVGAIIGFGIIYAGVTPIDWGKVGTIAASWVVSPLVAGFFGFILFKMITLLVFKQRRQVRAAKRLAPLLVFGVFFILSLVTVFKGLKNLNLDLNLGPACLIASGVGLIAALVTWFLVRRISEKPQKGHPQFKSGRKKREYNYGVVEHMFGYLQILSACFVAFAHGANDVANAIGPLSAAVQAVREGIVEVKSGVPIWALLLGGTGIVIGLATWGWRVIETVGKKITELTPTRGFSAEFGAAVTIVVASRLGLPISTTHTLVGAVLGVGLARGISALNLRIVRDIAVSWIITLPIGAGLAIIFYWILSAIFVG